MNPPAFSIFGFAVLTVSREFHPKIEDFMWHYHVPNRPTVKTHHRPELHSPQERAAWDSLMIHYCVENYIDQCEYVVEVPGRAYRVFTGRDLSKACKYHAQFASQGAVMLRVYKRAEIVSDSLIEAMGTALKKAGK